MCDFYTILIRLILIQHWYSLDDTIMCESLYDTYLYIIDVMLL